MSATETRWIARGAVAEDHPTVKTSKGEIVWLGWDPSGGGWHQWSTFGGMGGAKVFESAEAARSAAMSCPGPWYNQPDKETVEILEVEYTPARPASVVLK